MMRVMTLGSEEPSGDGPELTEDNSSGEPSGVGTVP